MFDLKSPCKNCPFRNDVVYPLRLDRVADILLSLTENDDWFACHKTTAHDEETDQQIVVDNSQHCAGAAILLDKISRPNQMMRVAMRLRIVDFSKFGNRDKVFDSIAEMLQHYRGDPK